MFEVATPACCCITGEKFTVRNALSATTSLPERLVKIQPLNRCVPPHGLKDRERRWPGGFQPPRNKRRTIYSIGRKAAGTTSFVCACTYSTSIHALNT